MLREKVSSIALIENIIELTKCLAKVLMVFAYFVAKSKGNIWLEQKSNINQETGCNEYKSLTSHAKFYF